MAGNPNYIQMPVDGAGKKVQTWDNTISGSDVHTEAITITDSTGAEKAVSGNPLRVDPTGSTVQPISGTVADSTLASSTVATGSAAPTTTVQVGGSDGTNLRVFATDASGQLKVLVENSVAVTGTFWQATQPVSGTFWQTTQPVSGVVTAKLQDASGNNINSTSNALNVQVANSSIAVTGTFWQATQPVSLAAAVTVVGDAASGSAVAGNPVLIAGSDGTDARSLLTDSTGQLKVLIENGSAISVSGTVNAANASLVNTSVASWTSATAANTAVTIISNSTAYNSLLLISNVASGSVTGGSFAVEGSQDNSNWTVVTGSFDGNLPGMEYWLFNAGTQQYLFNTQGYSYVRIRVQAQLTGTATITFTAIAESGSIPFTISPISTSVTNFPTTQQVEITDGTNGMGAMTNFGTTPTAVKALNANVSLFQGTTAVGSGAPLYVQFASAQAVTLTSTTVTGTVAVTESGTWTVQVKGNAGAAFDAATNAAPPANAIQVSGVAATALPSAFTATDTSTFLTDKFGRQAVVLSTVRDLTATWAYQSTSGSAATMISAGGSGVYTDITELVLTNESATATVVTITDGTTSYLFALAGNGGMTKTFATPLKAASTNTVWQVSNSAAVHVDTVGVYVMNK